MQKENIKFDESLIFEGMTSIRAIIKSIDDNLSDRRIKRVFFDKDKYKKISKEVGYLRAVSTKYGFELVETTSQHLENLTLGNSHGGIIADATFRTIPELTDAYTRGEIFPRGFYCIIQGIEDPYNFGYAIRSLYACGCNGIILGERNWMSAAGVVCRSSAGASELITIYKSTDSACVDIFKSLKYNIVCADERTNNILGECELPYPLLLLVGGEKRGISKELLSKADKLVKIDYARDFRASLSAASATTMFAYEIMRQNKKMLN